MCRDSALDMVMKELRVAGVSARVENGKHYKVKFQIGNEKLTYVVPRSASDYHTGINCRAGIRRILRSRGFTLGK